MKNVNKLVYFKMANEVNSTIQREKQIKRWKREWKIKLIEKENPCWIDLYYNLE